MAAFATINDLIARWRPLSVDEHMRAVVLLDDASATIRAECAGVDAKITATTLDPDIPRMVACRMVKRAMVAGPEVEGATQKQESVGAVALSMTFANPMGDLYVTKQERRMLGYGTARAFMVDLAPADAGATYATAEEF